MKKLIKEQIIKLHSMAIKQSGGMNGVRDDGLLDLALNSHPFIDGNKRIGILAMLVFLDVNQIMIDCSDEDVIDLGLGVASGKYKTDYIMTWIINHSSN
ncbi:MAG: death on curing protein [Herbinix sp.]|nr:death on curing protein [Herbinix sp.]